MNKLKIFLSTILILCSVTIDAQINSDYVDEFTGDTIISTDGVALQRNFTTGFVLNLKHQQSKDFVGCTFSTTNSYFLSGGESLLYIKFTDGSIRKAVCLESKTADYLIMGGVTIWSTSMLYIPEDGMLEDLVNKEIAKFRYETSIGYFEHNVKIKTAKKFQKQAKAYYERLYNN